MDGLSLLFVRPGPQTDTTDTSASFPKVLLDVVSSQAIRKRAHVGICRCAYVLYTKISTWQRKQAWKIMSTVGSFLFLLHWLDERKTLASV